MRLNTIRGRIALLAGAATIFGLLALYAPAHSAMHVKDWHPHPDVPPAIKVPQGNKLFLVVAAVGTQNYTCSGAGTWGASVPAANMYNKHGVLVGTHFGGPTWQYKDGSSVQAMKIAGVTVNPGAIDWLLLKSVSTSPGGTGGDKLKGTTYIQRAITTGGLAPGGACTPAATANVPYTAVYYFYRAKVHTDEEDEVED